MRGRSTVLFVALCAVIAGGCSGATKAPFARSAAQVAGALSAAALTIEDLHGGRLTREYAAAALGVLASELETAPDELRSAEGAPDPAVADRSARAVARALEAVRSPCLGSGCDAAGQVERLRSVAAALADVAGG